MQPTIVSTQYILPGSVIQNGQTTGNLWTDPTNILLVDGDFAESQPYTGTASDITIGNYDFSTYNLPQNAVITGIEMRLVAKRGAQTSPVITLTPYLYDNTNGANDFYPYVTPITTLTETLSTFTLGGSNYLFASSFTVDQINNIKFNLVANGDVYVDSFLVKIYYYIPTSTTPVVPSSSNCEDCNSVIQVQAMYLALPFLINQTKFYLQPGSLTYPNGTPVQPGDVGECGGDIPLVFDESKNISDGNFEENAKIPLIDGDPANSGTWTVLPNGVVEVDIKSITNRGLDFKTPYGHNPLLMSDHDANSKVIISNSGFFTFRILYKCHIGVLVSGVVSVLKEDVDIVNPATKFNFIGAGVGVTQDPGDSEQANIIIPGAGGTTPPIITGVGSGTSGNIQVNNLNYSVPSSGTDRGAIVQISTQQNVTVTSVSVGGVACVQLVSQVDVVNNIRQEQWGCVAQPIGNNTVTITLSGVAYISSGSESFANVNQLTPYGAVNDDTGNSSTATVILATTSDYSIVVDGLATAQTPILHIPGAGQVLNWTRVANSDTRQGSSSYELAGTQPDNVTMDYILTQVTDWVITAVEVIGITATIPTSPDEMVKVDALDSTTGFLDDKIEITAGVDTTVTKTILNIGGNEKIRYQINATGGGGGGSTYIIDQLPQGIGSTYPVLTGAIDGLNTTFVVSQGAYASGTLEVYLNGQALQQGTTPAEWVETNPASGTFDFVTPPIPGDIITVLYQTTSSIAQTGIQWQDEGINLGTPGTVNEVDVTGAGASATRVGNKVTINVPSSGGGGGGFAGGFNMLPIGKYFGDGSTSNERGNDFRGNLFIDSGTSRLYATFRDTGANASESVDILRIFRNEFGSYYMENNGIQITTSMLSDTTGRDPQVVWTSDGSNLFAIVEYIRTSGVDYRRIDVIRFDLDGTNPSAAVNIYAVSGTTVGDRLSWSAGPGSGARGAVCVGTSMYLIYFDDTTAEDQLREYDISAFPVITLSNTYIRNGTPPTDDPRNLSYDSFTGFFYMGGLDSNDRNNITKLQIAGPNFSVVSDESFSEIPFGNIGASDVREDGTPSHIVATATYFEIYVVQPMSNNFYGGTSNRPTISYWLMIYNYPKF